MQSCYHFILESLSPFARLLSTRIAHSVNHENPFHAHTHTHTEHRPNKRHRERATTPKRMPRRPSMASNTSEFGYGLSACGNSAANQSDTHGSIHIQYLLAYTVQTHSADPDRRISLCAAAGWSSISLPQIKCKDTLAEAFDKSGPDTASLRDGESIERLA